LPRKVLEAAVHRIRIASDAPVGEKLGDAITFIFIPEGSTRVIHGIEALPADVSLVKLESIVLLVECEPGSHPGSIPAVLGIRNHQAELTA